MQEGIIYFVNWNIVYKKMKVAQIVKAKPAVQILL
jgi:hypothetical protein